MTNTYRALDVVGEATYQPGEFEADLSATEEQDALSSGHLALVPRTYRQLSNNYTAAEQHETFVEAFLVDHEAALIAGGHIERVDPDEVPAGNAKREEWAAYALAHGASEDDLIDEDGKELGRDELRDKYGANPTKDED